MKERAILAVACLVLVGYIGVKHGRAYLNRPPNFTVIAYHNTDGRHEWSSEGTPTLVVFFRTTCIACSESIPVWKKLYRERCTDLRFLFLSAEPLEQVMTSQIKDALQPVEGCEPPALGRALNPATLVRRHRIGETPKQFLVVDGGAVKAIVEGAPSEEQALRLFRSDQ